MATKDERIIEIVVNGQKANANLKEMEGAARALSSQLRTLTPGTAEFVEKSKQLREVRGRLDEVKASINQVAAANGFLKQTFSSALGFVLGGGIEAAIGKVFELGRSIFDTSAKFEKYGAMMKTALGSESEAQQALADIQKMAAATPFSVDELTSSYIKFVNRGLQPSMAEMTKMADLAASQGKSFDQLTEAVLDAAGGEFERLKEFGIKASKSGNEVSLSFKGVQKTVANTPEAINAALLGFGEMQGIMGSTAAVSATLEGQMSNLGDTADQVAIEWGKNLRPVFVGVLSTLGFLLGALLKLPSFVKENRGTLLALAGAVALFNVGLIQTNAQLLYNVAAARAKVVWDRAVAISTELWTVAQTGLNVAMDANPIGAVVALVVLLAGAITLAYDKSETFRGAVSSLWKMLQELGNQFKDVGAAFAPVLAQLQEFFASLGGGDTAMKLFGYVMSISVVLPLKLFVANLQLTIDALTGLWDVGKRVANFFGAGFQVNPKGWFGDLREHAVTNGISLGKTLLGLDVAQGKADAKDYTEVINAELAKAARAQGARWAAERAAARAARVAALQDEEAGLRERLARVQEGSLAEMRLKQQLATNKAKQELEDEKKTEAQRRVIVAEAERDRAKLEADYNKKAADATKKRRDELARARKEFHQESLKADLEYEKLKVEAMDDGIDKVLAKLKLERDEELRALAEKKRLVLANTAATAHEKQHLVDQYNETAKLAEQRYQTDVAKARADQARKDEADRKKTREEQFAELDAKAEEEIIWLDNAWLVQKQHLKKNTADYLRAEQDRATAELRIRVKLAKDKLALMIAEGKGETAEAQKLRNALLKIEGELADKTVTGEESITEFKKTEAQKRQDFELNLAASRIQSGQQILDAVIEHLDKESAAYQIAHALRKTLALAEIGINLQQELAVNALNAAKNPLNGVTAGAAGAAQLVVSNALSIVRAAVASATVVAFAEGGYTGAGAGRRDATGYRVAGVVHEGEWVAPKWMLQTPRYANVIGYLEAERRSYGGGSQAGPAALPPSAATGDGQANDQTAALLTLMLQEMRDQNQRMNDWQKRLGVDYHAGSAEQAMDLRRDLKRMAGL